MRSPPEDKRRPGGMTVADAVEQIVEARAGRRKTDPWRGKPLRFEDAVEEILIDLLRDHGVEAERT